MRAKTIRYGRVKPTEPYANERIEIEVELADGETAGAGLEAAKFFVAQALGEIPDQSEMDDLREYLAQYTDKGGQL